jgi:hypothetical protein
VAVKLFWRIEAAAAATGTAGVASWVTRIPEFEFADVPPLL